MYGKGGGSLTGMYLLMKNKKNNRRFKSGRSGKSGIVSLIILLACLAVAAICVFNLVSLYFEYKHGADVSKIADQALIKDEQVTYTEDTTGNTINAPFQYDHESALAMNKYSVGYFWFPGTGVRLPLVQGDYNDQFLHTAYDFSYSRAGTLFLESALAEGLNDPHVIIYGHHMMDGSMFSKNEWYKNSDHIYEDPENRYFYIYTPTTLRKYDITSVFTTYPADSNVFLIRQTQEELDAYSNYITDYSWYTTPYVKEGGSFKDVSQVVSLVNCEETDYGKRLVIQGILVSEVPFKDTPESGYKYKPILDAFAKRRQEEKLKQEEEAKKQELEKQMQDAVVVETVESDTNTETINN